MFYWTQLPIQITTALTLALTLWLAHLTWRMRPAPGANTLTWLLLSVSIWSGGYLVFFSVSDASFALSHQPQTPPPLSHRASQNKERSSH
ncbi:MAG: hypothetical protein ACKO9F_11650 [Caldilinea sp.]